MRRLSVVAWVVAICALAHDVRANDAPAEEKRTASAETPADPAQPTPLETTPPPADEPKAAEPPSPEPKPIEKKKRYTLPFALRPGVAPDVVRIDSAYAFQDKGATTASTLTAGGRPFTGTDLGFYARVGVTQNAPDGATNAGAVSNPLAFLLFTPQIARNVRLGLFGGVTVPIGMGGGDVAPTDAVRAGVASGIYSRQAMDNALFAVNYTTPTAGVDLTWMNHGFTLQAEATAFYLVRVRGEAVDAEPAKTNFTSGVHAGYLVANVVNVGLEAHYQRWISTPVAVQKDASLRDQLTAGGGLRFNVPLGDSMLARPGIAYFHPIDDPMAKNGYRVVQVDLPIVF